MNFLFIFIAVVAVKSQEILKELSSHPNWKLIDHGSKCGRSKPSSRIVGGKDAYLGQYPWIALLGMNSSYRPVEFGCGGSIINNRYILTAAHCIQEKNRLIGMNFARLGEYDKSTDEDCDVNNICAPPAQDIAVETAVCHPDYIDKNHRNDICLLRLASVIQFNGFVKPICLPSYDSFKDADFEGLTMEVAGWGKNDILLTHQFADVLSTLKIQVLSRSVCESKKIYQRAKVPPLMPQQICAGGVVGKDSCNGDSGGPLMSVYDYGGRPRYFVIGLVSFGPTKCGTTVPGIYTRVADYMPWILDNISE